MSTKPDDQSKPAPNVTPTEPPVVMNQTGSPGGIQNYKGNVTVNKLDIPEPKGHFRTLKDMEPFGEHFVTDILLTLETKVAINNLYVRVDSPTIVSLEVAAQRVGAQINGHSGVREGWAFDNVPQASGSYVIHFITKQKEKYKVDCQYQ